MLLLVLNALLTIVSTFIVPKGDSHHQKSMRDIIPLDKAIRINGEIGESE